MEALPPHLSRKADLFWLPGREICNFILSYSPSQKSDHATVLRSYSGRGSSIRERLWFYQSPSSWGLGFFHRHGGNWTNRYEKSALGSATRDSKGWILGPEVRCCEGHFGVHASPYTHQTLDPRDALGLLNDLYLWLFSYWRWQMKIPSKMWCQMASVHRIFDWEMIFGGSSINFSHHRGRGSNSQD